MVKRFFNEKEVTSTLVMDALYCGAKLLEEGGRRWLAQPQLAQQPQAAPQQAEQQQQQQADQQQQQADQQAEQQQAEQQPADGQQQTQQPPAASSQAVPTGVLIDAKRGVFFFAGDVIRCDALGDSDGGCVVWPADQHLQHSCHWHVLMRQTRSVCVSYLCRKPPPARHFGPQRAGAGSSRRHPSFPVG